MNEIEIFRQHIEVMYSRLEQLYVGMSRLPDIDSTLEPTTLIQLGVALEELQVANEELHQQQDQMAMTVENAAAKSQYYQDFFNQAPDAYLITNLEGKIQEANLAAAQLLNFSQLHLGGKILVTFVPMEERQFFRNQLNHLHQLKRPQTWFAHLQPRDGTPVKLSLTTFFIHNQNKKSVDLCWILRPFTAKMTEDMSNRTQTASKNGLSPWETETKGRSLKASQQPTQTECDRPLYNIYPSPLYIYPKGETIFLEPGILWQVQEGLVKLTTLTEDGRDILLGLISPSMCFGLTSPLLPVYQATTMSKVELIKLSVKEVEASSTLSQKFCLQTNRRLQQIEALLMVAGQRRVEDRLYQLLRLLKEEIGESVEAGTRLAVRLTHEDLASACCTTRVTMTRLLGRLRRERKIAFDCKAYIVLLKDF